MSLSTTLQRLFQLIKTTARFFISYEARNALMMFKRDACTAGKNPPTNPMNNENPSVQRTTLRFSENPNASSENEPKFVVENDTKPMNDAKNRPITPPMNESESASIKNAVRILLRRNPSARNVPISTVLFATDAYIVIIAPIIAPALNTIVIKRPKNVINPTMNFDCSR